MDGGIVFKRENLAYILRRIKIENATYSIIKKKHMEIGFLRIVRVIFVYDYK